MPIKLNHVSYTYMAGTPLERKALEDVSLEIHDGEILAIAGHTGSGKSTLLQLLNGLLLPSGGEILVDDILLTDKGSKQEKQRAKEAAAKVGMVFQYAEHQIFEETIYDEIAFAPRNLGLSDAEIEKRVREAMQLVGLDFEELRDRSPFQLSGGQMRRVAIAGILSMHPKYLVLDEPSAGLDAMGKRKLMQTIEMLHRKWKLTVILVSHNMDDIARLADRVALLKKGRLLIADTVEKVFRDEAFVEEAGLYPPQMVHFLGMLRKNGVPVETGAITLEQGVAEILKAGRKRRQ